MCHYSVLRQTGKRAWSQIWFLVLPRLLEWAHRLVWCCDLPIYRAQAPHLWGLGRTQECGWMAKGNCQATRPSSTGTLWTEMAFWGSFRCTKLSDFPKPVTAGHHTELLDSTEVCITWSITTTGQENPTLGDPSNFWPTACRGSLSMLSHVPKFMFLTPCSFLTQLSSLSILCLWVSCCKSLLRQRGQSWEVHTGPTEWVFSPQPPQHPTTVSDPSASLQISLLAEYFQKQASSLSWGITDSVQATQN